MCAYYCECLQKIISDFESVTSRYNLVCEQQMVNVHAIFYIFLCSGISTIFCSMMIDQIGRRTSFYFCLGLSMSGMVIGLLAQNVFFSVVGIICLFVCGSYMIF